MHGCLFKGHGHQAINFKAFTFKKVIVLAIGGDSIQIFFAHNHYSPNSYQILGEHHL